jgi:hypothetical protein
VIPVPWHVHDVLAARRHVYDSEVVRRQRGSHGSGDARAGILAQCSYNLYNHPLLPPSTRTQGPCAGALSGAAPPGPVKITPSRPRDNGIALLSL